MNIPIEGRGGILQMQNVAAFFIKKYGSFVCIQVDQ